MMNFSYKGDFSALDVHPRIIEGVRRANLRSFVQVLTLSTNDLLHLTRLSVKDVNYLQYCAADALHAFNPVTALQICHGDCPNNLQKCFLSSGCNIIDNFLKGGIISGLLTEISGESAAGKSQLCLQMCLMVQLSNQWGGLNGRAVYVCTEDVFPIVRLNSMVTRLKSKFRDFGHISFTDNIFVEHAADFRGLQSCLTYKVPFLITEKKVKLVIVDSIAAIMRNENLEKWSFKERYKKLSFVSSKLKELSFVHNIPVILVNQVVDNFSTSCMQDNMGKKMPCLGPAWADMMNIRLSLSRTNDFMNIELNNYSTGANKSVKANIRSMEILSAPHLPNISCRFVVDEDGVKGLDLHKVNKT